MIIRLLRNVLCPVGVALLLAAGGLFTAAPNPAGAQTAKPAAAGSQLPKAKQTTLGLYVTAAQAYEMWKASPDKVKVIDVRTPEEFAFVGHPEMAWNIPFAFVSYQRKGGKFTYAPQMNKAFVAQVKEIAQPTDILLVTCRSGGRGAMAVNQLAARRLHEGVQHRRWNRRRHGGRSRECLSRKEDEERLEELGALCVQRRSREDHHRGRRFLTDEVNNLGAKRNAATMTTASPRLPENDAGAPPRKPMRMKRLVCLALMVWLGTTCAAFADEPSYELWPEIDIWWRLSPAWRLSMFVPLSKNIETDYREGYLILQADYAWGKASRLYKARLLDENRAQEMNTWLARGGYLGGRSLDDQGQTYRENTMFLELHNRTPLIGDVLLSQRLRTDFRWLGDDPEFRPGCVTA